MDFVPMRSLEKSADFRQLIISFVGNFSTALDLNLLNIYQDHLLFVSYT